MKKISTWWLRIEKAVDKKMLKGIMSRTKSNPVGDLRCFCNTNFRMPGQHCNMYFRGPRESCISIFQGGLDLRGRGAIGALAREPLGPRQDKGPTGKPGW